MWDNRHSCGCTASPPETSTNLAMLRTTTCTTTSLYNMCLVLSMVQQTSKHGAPHPSCNKNTVNAKRWRRLLPTNKSATRMSVQHRAHALPLAFRPQSTSKNESPIASPQPSARNEHAGGPCTLRRARARCSCAVLRQTTMNKRDRCRAKQMRFRG